MKVLHHVAEDKLALVQAAVPEVEHILVPRNGPIDPGVRGDVLFTPAIAAENLDEALARGVTWVHTLGTGVDLFPVESLGDRTLTCSRGASAVAISEWVMAMILAAAKRLPQTWVKAPPERWFRAELDGLDNATLALIGYGGIGERIARLARAFDMQVRVFRRRAIEPSDGVTLCTTLEQALTGADHVVVAAPLTEDTRHLIGPAAFAAMSPHTHLVNIARGGLIDQKALRVALDDGTIAVASLDTVSPEPLPAGHWLYEHPRVRLSAHVSWSHPRADEWLLDSFIENLRRQLRGEPLLGVVDTNAGY